MQLIKIGFWCLLSLILTQPNAYGADLNNPKTIPILNGPVYLYQGETKSISVPGDGFVRKLFIQADSPSMSSAYVEVSAGGDIKGTLYLPGVDPHYVVTIEAWTSSIEFHVVNGSARLLAVEAVVDDSGEPEPFPPYCHTKMGEWSMRSIWLVEQLEQHSEYADYGKYLLPIKKQAGIAYAVAEAQGDSSGSARPYYEQLLAALDHAHPYLVTLLEVQDATADVLELMRMTENIRQLLH